MWAWHPPFKRLLQLACLGGEGTHGEEGFENRIVQRVESDLQFIDELMQAVVDNAIDIAVGQLRANPPQMLFGRIAECSFRGAGDLVQGAVGLIEAVVDRAGKLAVEHEELHDPADSERVV